MHSGVERRKPVIQIGNFGEQYGAGMVVERRRREGNFRPTLAKVAEKQACVAGKFVCKIVRATGREREFP
ncbi:MAG: hypothetical protein EB145_15665 [Proteobacteria bacterium]|nr:hypothetical protein [Pseudomonadota bacterium]